MAMEATAANVSNPITLEAIVAAAGMTSYAADCDVVVMKRGAPRVAEPFVPASEVVPPFSGD